MINPIDRQLLPSKGFGLIEVVFATFLVGVVLAVSVRGFGQAVLRQAQLRDRQRAYQFGHDLMNEILMKAYQEPLTGTGLGPDSGESSSQRSTFDDVDDYSGWSETPLKSESGTTIPNTNGWSRSVMVLWTDPDNPAEPVVGDEGVKVVIVTVTSPTGVTVEVSAIRCRTDEQLE